MNGAGGEALLAERRKRMAEIDTLPEAWRHLVHEFGWTIIAPFFRAGLKPGVAKHLIEIVLLGAHEIREKRSANCLQSPAAARVAKAISGIATPYTPSALAVEIRRGGGIIVPMQPTREMVLASMTALHRRPFIGAIDTERKHRLRLSDALAAAAKTEYGEGDDG